MVLVTKEAFVDTSTEYSCHQVKRQQMFSHVPKVKLFIVVQINTVIIFMEVKGHCILRKLNRQLWFPTWGSAVAGLLSTFSSMLPPSSDSAPAGLE